MAPGKLGLPASRGRKTSRSTVTAPDALSFDPAAREEYLTGFHKRKLARIKHAQEENVKREKEEKLRLRRELRQQRKTDLERHVQEVNRLVRQANGDISEASDSVSASGDDNDNNDDGDEAEDEDEEWIGLQEPEPINREDEFIDEDKYTVVTVETVAIDRSGFSRPGEEEESSRRDVTEEDEKNGKNKKTWAKSRPKSDKPKKKKKKFRYETKVERKAERIKQGMRRRKQKEARMNK